MNKAEIVDRVTKLRKYLFADTSEVVVGFGAAAVMHGIKDDANDIDVELSDSVYDYAKELCGEATEACFGPMLKWDGKVELHQGIPCTDMFCETELIDGVYCHTLAYLLHCYKRLASHPKRKPEKADQDKSIIEQLEMLVKSK